MTVTVVAVVFAAALAAVATQGFIYAAVAIVAALYVVVVLTVGARSTGILLMMLAFAAAPMYRGIENLTGGVPPTDVFVIAAIIHLLPTVAQRRLRVPPIYLVGLFLVALLSLVAVIVTGDLINNALYALQWLFFIGVLPLFIAWWHPDRKLVGLLLWSYLVGHLISTARAVLEGAVFSNRYDGLTHHPNAFGLAGLTAVAIVLYLIHEHKNVATRVVLVGFAAIGVLSISLSGGRAAIVVLVVLILLVPLVERSALLGVGAVLVGGLAVLSIPLIVESSGEETAIGRLAGGGTSSGSDRLREDALEDGYARLWESPILGSGFKNVELIHNVYLEAAVAIGILGLIAYLVVLFALARPLFSTHPLRRLTYMVWVFIGVAPTYPSLWDRTVWVPASLAALAMLTAEMRDAPADREVGPARGAVPGQLPGQPRSRLTWS